MQERWEEPGAEHALERTTASTANTAAVAITAPSAKDAAGQPGRVKRFLPFSTGTRDCVGQSLARMNYTTTVAMLLAHFKFQLAPEVTALSLWENMNMQTIEPAAFPKIADGRPGGSACITEQRTDNAAAGPRPPDALRAAHAKDRRRAWR